MGKGLLLQVFVLSLLRAAESFSDDCGSVYGDVVPLIQLPGLHRRSKARPGTLLQAAVSQENGTATDGPDGPDGPDRPDSEQGLACHAILASIGACNAWSAILTSADTWGRRSLSPRTASQEHAIASKLKESEGSAHFVGHGVLALLLTSAICLLLELGVLLAEYRFRCCSGFFERSLQFFTLLRAKSCCWWPEDWPRTRKTSKQSQLTALPSALLEEVTTWLSAEDFDLLATASRQLRATPREPQLLERLLEEARRLNVEQEALAELRRMPRTEKDSPKNAKGPAASSVLRRFLASQRRRLQKDLQHQASAERSKVLTEALRYLNLGMLCTCFLGEVLQLSRTPGQDASPVNAMKAIVIPCLFVFVLETGHEPIAALIAAAAAIWLLFDLVHREFRVGQ